MDWRCSEWIDRIMCTMCYSCYIYISLKLNFQVYFSGIRMMDIPSAMNFERVTHVDATNDSFRCEIESGMFEANKKANWNFVRIKRGCVILHVFAVNDTHTHTIPDEYVPEKEEKAKFIGRYMYINFNNANRFQQMNSLFRMACWIDAKPSWMHVMAMVLDEVFTFLWFVVASLQHYAIGHCECVCTMKWQNWVSRSRRQWQKYLDALTNE